MDILANPREEGGLGIRDFKSMNKALMMKWLWRFAEEKDALWRKVIAYKYGVERGNWFTTGTTNPYGVSLWRSIANHYGEFKPLVKFKFGDGASIRFWDEWWIGERPLRDMFPDLYNVSRNRDGRIRDFIMDSGEWNFHFRRNLFDSEIPSAIQCFELLNTVSNGDTQDEMIWVEAKDGMFSVKLCYNQIRNRDTRSRVGDLFPWKLIWNPFIPPKVSMLAWGVIQNRLATRDQLKLRGLDISEECVCCVDGAENINHLFLHGDLASSSWGYFLSRVGCSWAMPATFEDLIYSWRQVKWRDKLANVLWKNLPFVIAWSIWSERNNRIFRSEWCRGAKYTNSILCTWWFWAKCRDMNIPSIGYIHVYMG